MTQKHRLFLLCIAVTILSSSPGAAETVPTVPTDDPECILRVIHKRKSVRNYTGQKVSQDQLLTLIKAGMAAPTAMDRRPWAFIAITDPDILARLADELPYSTMVKQAGAAIAVCGIMSKTMTGDGREFWIQDCSAATENILLAAEAMGLGAVWTGMHPIKDNVATTKKILHIPDDVIPLCIIAVGYPSGEDQPKDKFDPAAIHWNRWTAPSPTND